MTIAVKRVDGKKAMDPTTTGGEAGHLLAMAVKSAKEKRR
jgi:hypothetical protein